MDDAKTNPASSRNFADLEAMEAWDYDLPQELIAAAPAARRSDARLLVSDGGALRDLRVSQLREILQAGDLLVFNDTRVVPARTFARRQSGGRVEILAVGTKDEGRWEPAGCRFVAMVRSNKTLRDGETLYAESGNSELHYLSRRPDGLATLELADGRDPVAWLQEVGEMPLPPYILQRRAQEGSALPVDDDERYQTVVAREFGAVAAPTAGLHFDEALLQALSDRGVERTTVTLNVGIGTFRPVRSERLSDHEMHSEVYRVGEASAAAILRAHQEGRRIVAVGTTVVRTLEAWAQSAAYPAACSDSTDLFIRPGNAFRLVDALITNFHLPRSTLLALVAAFHGYDEVRALYAHAVRERYRFFSYGDAMFLSRKR